MSNDTLTVLKDPDALLDYAVNWSSWLPTGDSISTFDVAVEAGDVVLDTPAPSETDGVVTAWISGGSVGKTGRVRFRVTTTQGRTDDRSIFLKIIER